MEKTTDGGGAKKSEIESGKGMAVLSYLGLLALIPYFAEKKNKFVRFHALQGMNLLLIWVAYAVLSGIVNAIFITVAVGSCVAGVAGCVGGFGFAGIMSGLVWLIGVGIGVIALLGLIYALQGKEKEVPILGKIKIIKQ